MCPCYVVIECVFFHAKRHRILRNFSCTAQLWNDRSCDQCQPITVQLPTTFHQSETCWFLSVVYESNKREHAQLCIGCVVKITPRIKVPLSHSWLSGKNQRRIYFNFTKGRHDITGVFQFIWPSVSMQRARTPPTPPNHPSINTPRHKTPIHSLWKRNNSTTRCPKISDPRAHYFCVRSSWFPPWPKVFVGKTNEMMSQHCSSTWNTSRMAGPASDASSPFQMKPSASFFFFLFSSSSARWAQFTSRAPSNVAMWQVTRCSACSFCMQQEAILKHDVLLHLWLTERPFRHQPE